jgi:hypothetical protein
MTEEFWTKRDGTKIAVGNMSMEHLQNTLRMLIRKSRERRHILISTEHDEMSGIDESNYENMRDEQAYHNLANPHIFFPLLEGGVYGSSDLQKKYGRLI